VFWSDNQPVAAEDFRYAWINNLTPATVSPGAPLMDVVVGAQDLREGRVTEPDQLGVRAVDPYTLEILLEYPASYFIYLLAASITFPIPRHVAEEYGQQWCQPENIVSNGPFVLVSLDEDRVELVRNKNYFGTFNGNLSRMSWRFLGDERSLVKAFVNDKCDASWDIAPEYLSQAIHSTEIQILPTTFSMAYIQFNPQIYPMDDIRVRKAFAHAIPFTSLREIGEPESPRALGGIIPKGMPGYSPDIGFIYDPERAREYLAEAGFPEGTGFPTLELIGYRRHRYLGIVSEWEKILGVKVDVTELEDYYAPKIGKTPIIGAGWAADYPDPDSFLRGSMMYELLHRIGWEGLSKCGPLLEQAVTLMDRKQRLAIYREVDRILVEEQALIVPFERKLHHLIKPWVKDYHFDAMGYVKWKDIIIEPH
jgi:oligopeptide transport system substrate-binding protein